MTEKDGILTFECDKDENGAEILNSSQRNNKLVWPSVKEKPKAQYRTSWANMCNVTSYVMALEYAGWKFPTGPYEQPEDNLALFILTDPNMREQFRKSDYVMYNLFMKSLDGKLTEAEAKDMYFPNELHRYLCSGANNWIHASAAEFSTEKSFVNKLYDSMVIDNLPIVISTNFGGGGHIVTVSGVQYKKAELEKFMNETPDKACNIVPTAIIVDDPWGKYNPATNKYDADHGGNDIVVPWSRVVASVKPYNSTDIKWMHTFNHGEPTI